MSARPITDPSSSARRRAGRLGRLAEVGCASLLRLKGFHILARGFRVPMGEIDIVARRGRILVFVEVKARAAPTPEILTVRQQRRIVRAAEAFLMTRPDLSALDLRFDLMLVGRSGWPKHLAGAWRPDR